MKAQKITVTIKVEVLDLDSVPGLVAEALNTHSDDNLQGNLVKTDGDRVEWRTVTKNVSF